MKNIQNCEHRFRNGILILQQKNIKVLMTKFKVNTHHAYLNTNIVIEAEGPISIEDTTTGIHYSVRDELKIRLSAGRHVLKSNENEEEIIIEDAIKLGGSQVKNAFVFDNNPWIFVTTKDRLYITNIETHEEKVEYNITPDIITSLPPYLGKLSECFLFQTQQDYAIYDVQSGKIIFQFTNHIYSNGHLVIFKQEDGIEVYDFRIGKTIVHFVGQYSFGTKFYFVKDKGLHGMNLSSSYINHISYVGEVKATDMLIGNHLLRLDSDITNTKKYYYFSLGNGENSMKKTELKLPYYIEKWIGETTPHFIKVKEDYGKFSEAHKKYIASFPNISTLCFGIRVTKEMYRWETGTHFIKLHGEIITYPASKYSIPFYLEGVEGECIDFANYILDDATKDKQTANAEVITPEYVELPNEEKVIGKSQSDKLIITQTDKSLYLRDLTKDSKQLILPYTFDTTNYSNAYFTSDGKSVFLRTSKEENHLFGFDNLTSMPFDVESFTIARNEGFNGYKPEVLVKSGRNPVWRDPITLEWIDEDNMSSHVFMSPDGQYTADLQMKTVLFNRLEKKEISTESVNELRKKYNWTPETKEEEIKAIIELRKQLAKESDRYDLFGKIIDANNRIFSNVEDEEERLRKREKLTENDIEEFINKKPNFVSLFIDNLGFVCFRKKGDKKDKQILVGRSVYFLNYVSFSYDSKYLSFAAKMNTDDFRASQEGVFEIYDLEKEKIVNRIEQIDNQQLWAVWMTMFSKKGDVAFYDSCANAYLVSKKSNYAEAIKSPGKSLLCFSPSGKYVACSDQNYVDFTHHPYERWGHQPSGNVFIHATDNFKECLEQYNDMGDGISGVACKARNVSSAAFSQDELKLLVVGNDGVVVVRNLKHTRITEPDINCEEEKVPCKPNEYGAHFGEYAGSYAQDVMDYSDEMIDDAFDGDPDAYWNID